MKKIIIYSLLIIISLVLGANLSTYAASISIAGAVKQPLNLTIEDLCRFKTVRIQLNEILKDKSYRGAWYYNGVPLRTLLETAYLEKEESAFNKAIDLAILVRNSEGEEVALSWGEIFYKNSYDIIIATSATPIKPHHDCNSCHKPEETESRMKQFDRKIGFPKLVVASDGYADRSIENITSIEVIDPAPRMPADKSKALSVDSFVVTGKVKKELTINDLSGFINRRQMPVIHMGEGKGYHGIDDYSGVLFNDILEKAGIEPNLSQIFHISAPDGYRTTFSYGEIFLNRVEDNTIIADMKNGKRIEKEGKFIFVPSDDLMADRDIKSVSRIEVIDLKRAPKLTYIGIGPGDTDLITMEAVTAMSKADVFICSPDMKKRFGKYMGDKPILLDIYDFIPPVVKKQYPNLTQEELQKKLEEKRAGMAASIKVELDKGKHVAILEYGDPTIWSGSEYIMEHFDKNMIDIIPGLSSFNVASALLNRHTGCKGSIVLTTSRGILDNKPMFEAAAINGETLSVFMAMKDIQALDEFFNKVYKVDTPVHIAYRAGYSGSEKVVITNIKEMKNVIDSEAEKNLFLVFVGPCLTDSVKAHRH
jgi:precorrin-4 methylase/DMSO/TMAO reductase YedYZ molybdopterin-dependent catalytic subunit